jgi:hypothetical protein
MAARRSSRPVQRRAEPRSRLLSLERAVRTLAIIQTKQQREISDLKEGMSALKLAVLAEIRDQFKAMTARLEEKLALFEVLNRDLPERVRRTESTVQTHDDWIQEQKKIETDETRLLAAAARELKP